MCRVKTRESITNNNDLQNLVIGVLNRQISSFIKDDILNTVVYYCEGSNLGLDRQSLSNIIDENLDELYVKGFIDCRKGEYYPQLPF